MQTSPRSFRLWNTRRELDLHTAASRDPLCRCCTGSTDDGHSSLPPPNVQSQPPSTGKPPAGLSHCSATTAQRGWCHRQTCRGAASCLTGWVPDRCWCPGWRGDAERPTSTACYAWAARSRPAPSLSDPPRCSVSVARSPWWTGPFLGWN